MVLPVPVGRTSRGRAPRGRGREQGRHGFVLIGPGRETEGWVAAATASIMRAPRVVGTRRADAVPEDFTDRCSQVCPQVTSVCNGACRDPTGGASAPCRTRPGTCTDRLVAVQACWTAAQGG